MVPDSIYDKFGVDEVHARLDFGECGWIELKRAGPTNSAYQRRLASYFRKYRRQLELDLLPEDVVRQEFISIYADTIVVDGELRDRSGEMVRLGGNREATVRFFSEMADLFVFVREQAESIANFRSISLEDEAKN